MRKRLRKKYGRARRDSRVAHIVGAWITHYGDTGDVKAYVRWQDSAGHEGTTEGDPNNAHMQALLDRAIRSGVRIKHETRGAVILRGGGSRVVPPSKSVPARFMGGV